jgi:hypothetical protein
MIFPAVWVESVGEEGLMMEQCGGEASAGIDTAIQQLRDASPT